MAPRPRLRKNAGLPPNLYCQDGYYHYRHPQTKKTYGLGRDKGSAITQAVQANLHIQKEAVTLLDRITGAAKQTVGAWIDEYEKTSKSQRIKPLRDGLGHYVLAKLEPKEIADWLKRWDGKDRMKQAMLGEAKACFNAAIASGWIKSNPAAALKTKNPETKRERLTLDQYNRILEKADTILRNAMNLALLTGQRREDITKLQFSQVKDGYLWVIQGKTKAKIRIPLTLTLKAVGLSFDEAIQACRDNVLSPWMIHYSEKVNGSERIGGNVLPPAISRRFAEAREAAGIKGDNPPTFHEIRSLSGRLYRQQGIDVMTLLGHKTKQMSDLYQDDRGAEWRTVAV